VGVAATSPKDGRSKVFALLYVPRLRSTAWELPVMSGTSDRELNSGVGHHADSALPWQDGNVVISGHRTSYGRPFAEIEKLKVGDKVFLETRDAWYVYTLVDDAVVKPEALWVKDTPPIPTLASQARMLTLITCTPKGSVAKRWVWWGTLTQVRDKDDPPPGIGRRD
jgi:sortase A